jgi:glycosyltransferase involved in cell wall biosynthesis
MKDAAFLVFPTSCYEGFPMVLLEAMATGLPVIATAQGSVPELVRDHQTGLLVPTGDDARWRDAVQWALSHPERMMEMGRRGRREFEDKYTPAAGYRLLADVYERTLALHGVTT